MVVILYFYWLGGPSLFVIFFFFQAEDGIRDGHVTGVQTCALPICSSSPIQLRAEARDDARWRVAAAPARSARPLGHRPPETLSDRRGRSTRWEGPVPPERTAVPLFLTLTNWVHQL